GTEQRQAKGRVVRAAQEFKSIIRRLLVHWARKLNQIPWRRHRGLSHGPRRPPDCGGPQLPGPFTPTAAGASSSNRRNSSWLKLTNHGLRRVSSGGPSGRGTFSISTKRPGLAAITNTRSPR